jgi:hypothetical protein
VGHHHWVDSGIPASDEFRVIERIRLVDKGMTMEVEYTLIDPKGWEGEWKYAKRFRRVDERDIAEVSCLPDLNENMPSVQSEDNVR